MRHVRIPRRDRIRNTEVVQVVDNTKDPADPLQSILWHLEKIKRIIQDTDGLFTKGVLTAIKRSITAIENKVNVDDEKLQ